MWRELQLGGRLLHCQIKDFYIVLPVRISHILYLLIQDLTPVCEDPNLPHNTGPATETSLRASMAKEALEQAQQMQSKCAILARRCSKRHTYFHSMYRLLPNRPIVILQH